MYLIYEEPTPWPALGCPILTEILLVTGQGEGEGGDIYMRITRQSYKKPRLLSSQPMIVYFDLM